MLVDNEHRWVFIHIPKTAGQAVTNALGRRHSPADHHIRGIEQFNEYFRFCVVRDPVTRFVSAYRYSVEMAQKGRFAGHPVREFISRRDLTTSVSEFIDSIIEENLDIRSSQHFRQQIWWLRRGRPQYIMRYETLSTDLDRLGRFLDKDLRRTLHPVNVSHVEVDMTLGVRHREWLRKEFAMDFRALGYEIS